jgi:hypothetical protein
VIGSPDQYYCKPTDSMIHRLTVFAITANTANAENNQVMGGFWSSMRHDYQRGRSEALLDKARMQFLAAVPGSRADRPYIRHARYRALHTGYRLGQTYCEKPIPRAIITQAGLLGAYNESGDSGVFTTRCKCDGAVVEVAGGMRRSGIRPTVNLE